MVAIRSVLIKAMNKIKSKEIIERINCSKIYRS